MFRRLLLLVVCLLLILLFDSYGNLNHAKIDRYWFFITGIFWHIIGPISTKLIQTSWTKPCYTWIDLDLWIEGAAIYTCHNAQWLFSISGSSSLLLDKSLTCSWHTWTQNPKHGECRCLCIVFCRSCQWTMDTKTAQYLCIRNHLLRKETLLDLSSVVAVFPKLPERKKSYSPAIWSPVVCSSTHHFADSSKLIFLSASHWEMCVLLMLARQPHNWTAKNLM